MKRMIRLSVKPAILASLLLAMVGSSRDWAQPAQMALAMTGASITVNTVQDIIAPDGLCSLREAIIAANTNSAYNDCPAGGSSDTIGFDAGLPSPAVFQLTNTGAGEDAAQTGDLDISGTVTITGGGANVTILDGNQTDRVLDIRPAAIVTISGVTIRHGNPGAAEGGGAYIATSGRLYLQNSEVISNVATAGGGVKSFGLFDASNSNVRGNNGGGIKNDAGLLYLSNVNLMDNTNGFGIVQQNSGQTTYDLGTVGGNSGGGVQNKLGSTLTLSNLTISGNTAGGGVYNSGATTTKLTLSNSTIENNSATSGAGILNDGIGAVASISNTTIRFNTATAAGGGINNSGSLDISRSTIDHNQARSGGGIDHIGSSLKLTNVTISQNSVSDNGGGLYNRTTATLNFVTLYGNSAGAPDTGGNLYNDGDSTSISFHNTILTVGGTAGNCVNNQGQINSQGYNLEDANTCGFTAAGDQVNTDPQLGTLQNNGGLTQTHALLPASPAVGGGDSTGCSGTTDQRGVTRPQGLTCDTGAYELVLSGEADLSITKVDALDPVLVGAPITYTLSIANAGPDGAQNVVLTDALPNSLVYSNSTPSQGTCSILGQVFTCDLGDIANGASASVELLTTASSSGLVTNSASVAADTFDPNSNNNSASQSTLVEAVNLLKIYLPTVIK